MKKVVKMERSEEIQLLINIVAAKKAMGGCLCGHGESCSTCSMDRNLSKAIYKAQEFLQNNNHSIENKSEERRH